MEALQNLLLVFRRENVIWAKRPIYIIGTIFVLAFCCIFYLSLLKDGVPSKLPIAVVDLDNSSLSRNFIEQLDATQLGSLHRYQSFSEARDQLQKGNITSIIVIPEGAYRDLQSFRQPEFTFYINGLYFLGGSLAYKDLITMVNLTSGAVQRQVLRARGYDDSTIMGLIKPVDVDIHQIGNPTMNYGAYLANMMIPGVMQMVIILMVIYSIGTELKYKGSKRLMELAGGNIHVAIFGKMIFYTAFFTLLGIIMEILLYRWMHFPMAGSVVNMFLAVFLFIIASEAIAVAIIGFVPILRFSLSVGSLYSVLGFSLTGFTLPVEAMPAGFRGLSALYPLRHYYLFYVQEGFFGSGFAGWWKEAVILLCFLFLPLLSLHRLKHAYEYQDYSID